MAGPLHLARRFFGSLSPRPLAPADDAWVRSHLLAGEQDLWQQMSRPDRKHAAGVAREADRRLGGADRAVIAAAALHDVGKIRSRLGTLARSVVTVLAAVVGRSRLVEHGHASPPGSWPRRVSEYLAHDRIGAELLRAAGADALTVAWAGEHHRSPGTGTVPGPVAQALAAADDD